MLAGRNAMATVAVKDIGKAKKFYGETLGLKALGGMGEEAVTYASGNSTIVVYRSQFAGTNKATSATWGVGEEIETIIATLKAAGVKFEHYDIPGLEHRGDLHVANGFKAAWFKDPDGNILHINNA